ncbi:hypothetical protein, partial [Nocardioides malaquae]|uniref:hypothetical protein n=1 Tax=Nocardioides malaquae TaxID=2773426 RepID=UPI001D0CFE1D
GRKLLSSDFYFVFFRKLMPNLVVLQCQTKASKVAYLHYVLGTDANIFFKGAAKLPSVEGWSGPAARGSSPTH